MEIEIILLALIVYFAFTVSTVVGFGGNVIAVSLGLHLYPLELLLPILVPLNILNISLILSRHYSNIDIGVLKRSILPFVLPGLFLGILIFNSFVINNFFKSFFGLFVLGYAATELIKLRQSEILERPMSFSVSGVCLFASGFIQGIYACGGPLLVAFAKRKFSDKNVFRSTVMSVFILYVTILLLNYSFTGKLNSTSLIITFTLLPFQVFGFLTGERIFFRIKQEIFKIIIVIVLLASGFSLLF